MPSKLLIAASHAAHAVRQAGTFGVEASAPRIDGRAVMARVRRLRDRFVDGVCETVDAIPDGIAVRGRARFAAPDRLELEDGGVVPFKAAVIATGSHSAVPDPLAPAGDRLLTNESVFELDDLPRSLAVVGAGPLGIELAQAMARLGVEVALFDQGDGFAGLPADDAVGGVLREAIARDLTLRLGVELAAERTGDGVRVSWTGAETGSATFERLLVAAGRPPSLAGLGLEQAGLALDDHGTPLFDRGTLQCGDAPVFIAGDANADRPVLHEASSEGAIAGRNAAQYPDVSPGRRTVPFAITFCDPQLAVVGRHRGDDLVVGTASFADQGRATAMATNEGLVRIAARADGRIVGAAMAAPMAEHLGHLLAWAVEAELTATHMLDRPIYHPTYEEGLKPALREICHQVGARPPSDRDEGNPAGG